MKYTYIHLNNFSCVSYQTTTMQSVWIWDRFLSTFMIVKVTRLEGTFLLYKFSCYLQKGPDICKIKHAYHNISQVEKLQTFFLQKNK